MPDLSRRWYNEEWMDDLNAGGREMDITLRELDFINKWLGGNKATIDPVERFVRKNKKQQTQILDLGCGSGEMLRIIAERAGKRGHQVELLGIEGK